MADSKRGKPEREDPATIDRISSLPDCLLCHILSFLPTKTSVATSVLSHRWRHVWEHLQVFDFDDGFHDHHYEASLFERFAVFVNRVLALRTAPDIRKFRLSCSFLVDDDSSSDSVFEWVEAATGPHLEELQLSLHPDGWGFLLPPSVFTCEALVSLSLDGVMLVEVDRPPSSLRLPSLKILKLDDVEVDSINDFLSGCGCPALETLDLHFEGALRSPEIRVVASSLKSLTFADETDLEIEELEIDTPSLEYLNITLMPSCSRFSVHNLHNVVEAHLHFYAEEEEVEYIDFVLKLLRALCGTKFLVLRTSTVECLLRASILDFPEFGCLLRLQLFLPNFNTSFLVNVLQKCAVLQVLAIHMDEEQEASLLQSWTEPTSVPSCLVSHLTVIEFRGYEGFADELAFTAYILQRALALKTMTIHTDSSLDIEEKHDILKELSVIPRGSNLCQLYFD